MKSNSVSLLALVISLSLIACSGAAEDDTETVSRDLLSNGGNVCGPDSCFGSTGDAPSYEGAPSIDGYECTLIVPGSDPLYKCTPSASAAPRAGFDLLCSRSDRCAADRPFDCFCIDPR